MNSDDEETLDLDLGDELGAAEAISPQVLVLYVPSRDRDGEEIAEPQRWIDEAAELLAELGGGVTVMPPVRGGWRNEDTGQIVWERTTVVYSYVIPERFVARLRDLREFLHRLGRETNQGEVALEFDKIFFRIVSFDEGRS